MSGAEEKINRIFTSLERTLESRVDEMIHKKVSELSAPQTVDQNNNNQNNDYDYDLDHENFSQDINIQDLPQPVLAPRNVSTNSTPLHSDEDFDEDSSESSTPRGTPEKLATEEEFEVWKDAKGKIYFYNTQTKQSQWNRPIHLFKQFIDHDPGLVVQRDAELEGVDQWEDEHYFSSYADLSLQQSMVQDRPRSELYQKAIMKFKDVDFQEKVVLDVGCGTGLLSFFAAQAGARKVYAIEMSDLADLVRVVVQKNKMEQIITVFKTKVEDLELPEQVDVIVSEWMGSIAIFEGMIESVLVARDKFLKPNGIIYPSDFAIYLAPIQISSLWNEKINFWKNVYGVDMSSFMDHAKHCSFQKPICSQELRPENIISTPLQVTKFDLLTMSISDLEEISAPFEFRLSPDTSKGTFHGFAGWFDVTFFSSFHKDKNRIVDSTPIVLGTSPSDPPTHWKQDLWIFEKDPWPLEISKDEKAQVICGQLVIRRNAYWRRHYNIHIDVTVEGSKYTKVWNRWRAPSFLLSK